MKSLLSNTVPESFQRRSPPLLARCDSLSKWMRAVEQAMSLFFSVDIWLNACERKCFPILHFYLPAGFLSCVSLYYSQAYRKSLEEIDPSLGLGLAGAADERVVSFTGLRALGWRWDKVAGRMMEDPTYFSYEELPPVSYAPAHLQGELRGQLVSVPFASTRGSTGDVSATIAAFPDMLVLSTESQSKWSVLGAAFSVYHQ